MNFLPIFRGIGAVALLIVAPARAAAPIERAPVGVIVGSDTQALSPAAWLLLVQLQGLPEIHYLPKNLPTDSPERPFDFSELFRNLDSYRDHGISRVAITPSAERTSIAVQPQRDERGTSWTERPNPFDPAFVREWERMYRELTTGPLQNERAFRVYVAPPSFYGEGEYFMGTNWSDLRFLAYDSFARDRFVEWLKKVGRLPVQTAGGRTVASSSALKLPRPPSTMDEILAGKHDDWLDFMEWRRGYLTNLIATPLRIVGGRAGKEAGVKISWGDTSAWHGTDTAAIYSQVADVGELFLHSTDVHSAADLAYADVIVRRYHLRELVAENDGNRYGRTEIAKSVLNCLLAGASMFNFAWIAHLTDAASMPTESYRALVSAREAIAAVPRVAPPISPIAFLHSTTTREMRAPRYVNKDAQLVYDALLQNERPWHEACYSWARYLGMPDVTGEQLILDGDLEGRKVIVIPNTSVTLLPSPVRARLMSWVEEGGVVVGFGSGSLGWEKAPAEERQGPACRQLTGLPNDASTLSSGPFQATAVGHELFGTRQWALPTSPVPVWSRPLPKSWEALITDGAGRVAMAREKKGRGALILFPQAVPEVADDSGFYQATVPLLLRAVAENHRCLFSFEITAPGLADRPAAPLAVKYLGTDSRDGAALFVGGADDRSCEKWRFDARACGARKVRLILIDLPDVVASFGEGSGRVRVIDNVPGQGRSYFDPTNMEATTHSLIPVKIFEFDASRTLLVRTSAGAVEQN